MQSLYTIGYTKKNLREFVGRLKKAKVDCVVDIRLHNTSQLAGFAKKDDLEFLLTEGFGIRYTHMPEFAPSEELLASYKSSKDWRMYESSYAKLIGKRGMVDVFVKAAKAEGWKKPCLLCAEDSPEHCHRRLLAEAVAEREAGLEVIHL